MDQTLKGVKRILSGSFAGYSVITVEFHTDVEPRDALSRLQSKVTEAQSELPKEADKPAVNQVSVNDSPIFSVRLYGDRDLSELSALANRLKNTLENIPGVNEAGVSGNRDEIIHIRLIGARLHAVGLSPLTIQNAVQEANLDLPWGQFDGEEVGAIFRLTGRYRNTRQLELLPIHRTGGGRLIRLGDLADISRTTTEERSRTFYSSDGEEYRRAVEIYLTKRAGADTIDVINRAKALFATARASQAWPDGVAYTVVVDESEEINADLLNVFKNGWQAMLAVFLVLLVSLTWREALVAGLAVPVTFAGALIIIATLGYSLNQIVIIGMVIALGLLVDVFILMMEGMHENMFVEGKSFSAAALATTRTYAAPALAGQLTTVLAMAPLLGIAGITGKFIRPMPMTAIACLVAAYLVAMLLTIPLSRYVLPKPGTKVKKTRIDLLTEKASMELSRLLARLFLTSRTRALIWAGAAMGVFGLSYILFSTLPSELMPKGDGRNMGVLVELEPDSSFETAQICADAVGERLRQLDYFESITKYVGEKSPYSVTSLVDQLSPTSGLNFVGFTTIFTPRKERAKMGFEYVSDVTEHIRPALESCPGGNVQLNPSLGGAAADAPIQVELIGNDMDQLRSLAERLVRRLQQVEGTRNVRHNLGLPSLDLQATPNMEALNFYGISPTDLAQQIRVMMTNDKIGTFVSGGVEEDIDIRMGYGWPSRRGEIGGPTTLAEAYLLNVTTPEGKSIPLFSLVDFELSEAALSILHREGKRTVTLLADTDKRTAGEVLGDIVPVLDAWAENWPDGYSYNLAGEAESGEEVFGSAGSMLVLALCLVFALLVLQFDSFAQPLVIMSAIPLALTGTFFGFFALQLPFSFMAMVGVIALIGIVVNDTIVMIATMNGYRKEGKPLLEATAHGAADRLRPILTTSITTIAGMIPLSLSNKMWLPLGVTVISGLIFATLLALFIVPCLYILFTFGTTVEGEVEA